jgi:SAM-dependent methyltransferase
LQTTGPGLWLAGRREEQVVSYDAARVAAYYDRLGHAEWDRWERSLGDCVSLVLHTEAVERFVPRGCRVLEIGAGPGRFTEVLHRLGCRIVVADLSATQLDCNRELGHARGFAASVEDWRQLDICDLGGIDDEAFDAVVVLGGPLSYVFEARDRALAECRRVMRPGGVIAVSVMSLWGTSHRYLEQVLPLGAEVNRAVTRTGDVSDRTVPGSTHQCHLFRAGELRDLLARGGFVDVWLSASSALSTGVASSLVAPGTEAWHTLLELERMACVEPGYLDAGTHLIAVALTANPSDPPPEA